MTLNKPARVNSGKSGETIANAILDEAVRAAVKLLRRFDRFYFRCVGEWLSLVEHLVRDQGVGGSNPLSPTKSIKHLQRIQACTFWVQFVQLAIGVPMVCGNQGQLALPWPSGKQHPS